MKTVLYISIGVLSGIISGMGIGGGVILIPALSIFFDMKQQAAQNINLIYFVPTAIVALILHIKNDKVEKKIVPKIVLMGLVGAALGAFLAISINSDILKKLFGSFLLFMGVIEFRKKEKNNKIN